MGHAYSALLGWTRAQRNGGRFLLRIEDIDQSRCKAEYENTIFDDLAWLGLDWGTPVMRQSCRLAAYQSALNQLRSQDLLYPCYCSRKEIAAALSAPHGTGDSSQRPYPGTCRPPTAQPPAEPRPDTPHVLRLNMRRAIQLLGGVDALGFKERGEGPAGEHGLISTSEQYLVERCGDVVLARRDTPTSYHLAVVVDDAAQGVTCVTRGNDLFEVTPLHRLLQTLLELPQPTYCHHRLLRNASGERLSKRDRSESLAGLRASGMTPATLRQRLGFGSDNWASSQ